MSSKASNMKLDDEYYVNYRQQVENKILRHLMDGMTVREAIEKVKPVGYLKEELIERFEKLWANRY